MFTRSWPIAALAIGCTEQDPQKLGDAYVETAPPAVDPGEPVADVDPGEVPDPRCVADSSIRITVPNWCASVFADGLGKARHLAVNDAGDVFVAVLDDELGEGGGVYGLRDVDDDGTADVQERIHDGSGSGIAYRRGYLWFGENDRVLRFEIPLGVLRPVTSPVTVVGDLPIGGDHDYKSVVVAGDASLYVNVGSASNSCQVENRELESKGLDPCPELATRAGIWRFDGLGRDQVQDDGERVATGIRNANAMAIRPRTGDLVVAVNGRDQLFENWPDLFTAEDDQRAPSEELLVVQEGADYGWPYCYHDPDVGAKVLAPEYGGDGKTIDRCAQVAPADAIFPAHWAPLGMVFLQQGGALVTFHGSRFDKDPEGRVPGYNIGYVPFDRQGPSGRGGIVATGFAGEGRPLPDAAEFRPVGVAQGPDGTVFVSDDVTGRIWRVFPPVQEAPVP